VDFFYTNHTISGLEIVNKTIPPWPGVGTKLGILDNYTLNIVKIITFPRKYGKYTVCNFYMPKC
jgi:hypothetical protein